MVDRLTPEARSRNMAAIRGKDTAPELAVRRMLHAMGYRFRLHRRDLPGSPDIVMPARHTAVFVHGCFWHQHKRCTHAPTPTSRTAYWLPKLAANVARDARNQRELREMGWRVVVVWECQVRRDASAVARRLQRLLALS
jgi:DNA mismatch endonuclease (patch repair protein)